MSDHEVQREVRQQQSVSALDRQTDRGLADLQGEGDRQEWHRGKRLRLSDREAAGTLSTRHGAQAGTRPPSQLGYLSDSCNQGFHQLLVSGDTACPDSVAWACHAPRPSVIASQSMPEQLPRRVRHK